MRKLINQLGQIVIYRVFCMDCYQYRFNVCGSMRNESKTVKHRPATKS